MSTKNYVTYEDFGAKGDGFSAVFGEYGYLGKE